MKLTLVGFVQSKGEYLDDRTGEAKPFDSVTLDCLSAASVKGANVVVQGGRHYKKVKFKTVDTDCIFDGAIKTPEELVKYIGKRIIVDGTQYNNSSGSYISADEICLDEHP